MTAQSAVSISDTPSPIASSKKGGKSGGNEVAVQSGKQKSFRVFVWHGTSTLTQHGLQALTSIRASKKGENNNFCFEFTDAREEQVSAGEAACEGNRNLNTTFRASQPQAFMCTTSQKSLSLAEHH